MAPLPTPPNAILPKLATRMRSMQPGEYVVYEWPDGDNKFQAKAIGRVARLSNVYGGEFSVNKSPKEARWIRVTCKEPVEDRYREIKAQRGPQT